jgi:phosphoribosylaminoimidazole-succinocarboxamide synthase
MTSTYAALSRELHLIHSGKVRDTYATSQDGYRLIVATDRISTHNITHLSQIPSKGYVLNTLSIFWFRNIIAKKLHLRHHMVACGNDIHRYLPGRPSDYPNDLHLRAMVVRELKMIPVEFIYRRYLTGSLYDKYHSKGIPNPYGLVLDPNLPLMAKLYPFIFTPTDKSATDEPLNSYRVTEEYAGACRIASQIFAEIGGFLNTCGAEMIDSKFELGLDRDGNIIIADEVCTPDSSRFANIADIRVGENPPWLDKQVARNWAESVWGKEKKEPLSFSSAQVSRMTEVYLTTFRRITGKSLDEFWV